MSTARDWAEHPTVRLFDPSTETRTPDGVTPELTLREFCERWFFPVVCRGKRGNKDQSIRKFLESLDYWEWGTPDPRIRQIDEYTIAEFQSNMRQATFRRSRTGKVWPLSATTRAGHLARIDRLLAALGPQYDPKRPAKRLLESVPRLEFKIPKVGPKPCFTLERAQELVLATERMPRTNRLPKELATWTYYTVIALWYYTGLRTGTVEQLRLDMMFTRDGEDWLKIPGSIVDKTSKPLEKLLHPMARMAVERLHAMRGCGSAMLVPWPHAYSWLASRHKYLQKLVGVPKEERLSPQAWRRTHSKQMGLLGLNAGLKVAQLSLDHANDRTTSGFYLDLEPELIRKLPVLDPPAVARQGFLF